MESPAPKDFVADFGSADVDAAIAAAFERIPPSQLLISDALIEGCEHKLRQALDIPLIDVLTGAWAARLPVMEALNETRSTPGATELVEIGKHEIKLTEHPEIALEWNQAKVFRLLLDLEIKAVLNAVATRISKGSIESIRPGSAELTSLLSYHDHALLPEWRIGRVDFQDRDGQVLPG